VVGIATGDGVVRRPHHRVAHIRAVGDHDLAVDHRFSGGRGRPGGRSEAMYPATILLPGSALELLNQWLWTSRHPAQTRLDLASVGERMQSFGASPQLTRQLRAPEQQHREECPLVGVQPETLIEDLVVLQRPPSGVRPHDAQQSSVLERPRCPLDGLFVEVDDRLPVARLVAGGSQRVGRERVRSRHRRLLLQQAAEDALIHRVENRKFGHPDDPRSRSASTASDKRGTCTSSEPTSRGERRSARE
jgi:hypothetical protein